MGVWSLVCVMVLASCSSKRSYFPRKMELQHVDVVRFDEAILNVSVDSSLQDIRYLYDEYETFMPVFTENILGISPEDTLYLAEALPLFLEDTLYGFKETNAEVKKQFADISDLEDKMDKAFTRFHYLYPEMPIPTVYFFISGFNASILFMEEDIAVGTDMYLGKDYKYYSQIGMPLFVSQRCEKKFVALDCISKALVYKYLPDKSLISLLDYIIYEGKRMYFTEMLFPKAEEQDIIEYTAEKYQWAVENQGQVWAYIIEKDLLFSKQNETIRQFVEDNPFTKPFVNTSPGRMGAFLGWKIVQGYMENNPEVSLAKLMEMTDSQMILNKSGYKPKRR